MSRTPELKLDELVSQKGEWLKGTGPESDVVVSTRMRLARNLARYPFLTVAKLTVRAEVEQHIRESAEDLLRPLKIHYFRLSKLGAVDRQLLFERHLISREHAGGEGERAVALNADESVSIMVNEEDHLRLQTLRSGLQLREALEGVDKLDSILEERLHFAFHPKFGYLTCCPTNVGTGMRISVMLHLPAVAFAKQIDRVLQSMQRLNYTVRGLYGEGTQPLGDFYQVSNQITLGKSEQDIVEEMSKVVPEVLRFERGWRINLLEEKPRELEDRVWRAYGILTHARKITTEETVELLSALRLGVNLGLIKDVPLTTVNELFIITQPSHLQKLERRALQAGERDQVRSEYVRKRLANHLGGPSRS